VCAGFKYGSRNVLADEGIREGVKKFTNWPTIPQVGTQTLTTAAAHLVCGYCCQFRNSEVTLLGFGQLKVLTATYIYVHA
jgi:hypothetical protein